MTGLEREISTLTKDVAVVVNVQKTLQASQQQTTNNINKLADAIQLLSHDAVYLKGLERRIGVLEESGKWITRTLVTGVISFIASAFWFAFKSDIG